MSDFNVIANVSETLRKILQDGMDASFGPNIITVTLDSPKKIEEDNNTEKKLLSVFIYKILENSDLKNSLPITSNNGSIQQTPLALDLFYMITPYGADEDNKLKILGRALQILYDNSIMQGSALIKKLEGKDEQIRISFAPLSQEMIVQIWQAIEASMRLAVFYFVSPVYIESERVTPVSMVKTREIGEP